MHDSIHITNDSDSIHIPDLMRAHSKGDVSKRFSNVLTESLLESSDKKSPNRNIVNGGGGSMISFQNSRKFLNDVNSGTFLHERRDKMVNSENEIIA